MGGVGDGGLPARVVAARGLLDRTGVLWHTYKLASPMGCGVTNIKGAVGALANGSAGQSVSGRGRACAAIEQARLDPTQCLGRRLPRMKIRVRSEARAEERRAAGCGWWDASGGGCVWWAVQKCPAKY